jgi:hypothetical protein
MVAHLHRDEHLLPYADRPIGRLAEHELHARIGRPVIRQQPAGMPAIAVVGDDRVGAELYLSGEYAIQRVTDASGAVVTVVVVPVLTILGESVPFHEIAQFARCFRRQCQLLYVDRAILMAVHLQHVPRIESGHPVPRVAGQEPPQEPRLLEIEQTPVVGDVTLLLAVSDPEGIVPEAGPVRISLTHGKEVHADGWTVSIDHRARWRSALLGSERRCQEEEERGRAQVVACHS